MPDRPLDIQKSPGPPAGQNWANTYLCDPTSVVTTVPGGAPLATARTIEAGAILSSPLSMTESRPALIGPKASTQSPGGAAAASSSSIALWSTNSAPSGTTPVAQGDMTANHVHELSL